MDKPWAELVVTCNSVDDWDQELFNALDAVATIALLSTIVQRADARASTTVNFLLAAMKKLRDLAYLGYQVTDTERRDCLAFAAGIEASLTSADLDAGLMSQIEKALAFDREFYETWGSATAREWGYKNGHFTAYGVRTVK